MVPLVEVVQGCIAHEQPQSSQELAIDKAAHVHREYRNTASRSVTNKLPIGEAVLHGKAACSKAVLHGGALYSAEFQYTSRLSGESCSRCVHIRMSSIELFDINSPLLSVGWRKWFAAPCLRTTCGVALHCAPFICKSN